MAKSPDMEGPAEEGMDKFPFGGGRKGKRGGKRKKHRGGKRKGGRY